MTYENKGANQNAHLCNLVSAFNVCNLDSRYTLIPLAEYLRGQVFSWGVSHYSNKVYNMAELGLN